MPTGPLLLYPGIDGYVQRNAEPDWAHAHDVTDGDSASSTATVSSTALRSSYSVPGRGSGYYVSRCFFSFDTSGIVNIPKSGSFALKGFSSHAADIIYCVKATSDIEAAITVDDFDSIVGWDHDADNTSNVTIYADNLTSWIVGNNLFTLNGQALADMAGQDKLNICLLTSFDILDTGGTFPVPSSTEYSGMYFVGHGTIGNRPVITLRQQDDSVFFGANF